jgi:ABC-type uncharacterized transport system permease subunit
LFDQNDDDTTRKEDRLAQGYDTILKESALLTTFAGILFGFLLEISINTPTDFALGDKIILLLSLFSITIAASLFVMPVIYHHIQYPYKDLDKFKIRSHRFIVFGLIPAGITLFLGLELALSSLLDRFPAFMLAAIPFVVVYILFRMRK